MDGTSKYRTRYAGALPTITTFLEKWFF